MPKAVLAKPQRRTISAPESKSVPEASHWSGSGKGAGVPLFLQHKCASCTTGEALCPECAEDEEIVQKKDQPGEKKRQGSRGTIHSVAREGVERANDPLPHLDRIQASFGNHDVRGIRAQVGGSAAEANDAMGSVGYTVGDRIGFKSAPDARLAAHEATHVLHQRGGVQLDDGVGHPGDPYEQEADAVADAVDRGESAEPILARCVARNGSSSAPSFDRSPVQHLLSVNATRLFEPPVISERAIPSGGAGAPTATRAPAETTPPPEPTGAGAEATAEEKAAAPEEGDGGGGGGGAPSPAPSAAPAAPAAAGGGATATATGAGACTGGVARCYDAPSEQPAQEPDETPKNPEGTHVEEKASDEGEDDAPEPDDCPLPEAAAAATGSPGPTGGAGPTPAGAPAAASPAAPASPAVAPETGSETAGPAGGTARSGGGASGAVPAAAGEAGEGAPPATAASPLDGAIAAGESQRDAAVAAYSDASTMRASASDSSAALRAPTTFAPATGEPVAAAMRRDQAAQRANLFFSGAADQLDQVIAFVSLEVPEQLGARAESAKADIAASIESQKASISARIEAARGQARADAAVARQQVMLQADAFVADVEVQTGGAIETLTAAHTDAMGRVADLETSTLDRVNQIYANGRTDLEGLGPTIGAEATATGETFAAQYRGFRHCTENGFWDGDLSERRSEAQENAARSVVSGYHDRIVESARKRAREITRAGRKEDRCTVIAAASAARDSLDRQLADLITALEGARDQSIQQAESTRDSITASIDDSLATTLRQLDQQEYDQRQAADDTGYLQQVLQEQIAHAGAAALQRMVASAAITLQSTLGQVQALFANSRPPDPTVLDQVLPTVESRVSSAIGSLQTGIEGGLGVAAEQLAGAAQQGLASLEQITKSNEDSVAALSGGFSSSMGAIGGTDNFAAQRGAFAQLMQQSADSGGTALNQVVDGMSKGCERTTSGAEAKLTQAHTSLDQSLRQSKQGIECEITTKADEAASHEAPAWKRLIAVLLIIVVIVIIVVVIVATAGGALAPLIAAVGPIAAAAIAGAVVGAVTSALITIATDLWGNRALSATRIAKAALVGAITGAIGGAAGAWVGGALQGASLVVQYGAAMALAGGLDVVTQFVMGGFSFEHFSLANLGLTLLITALTLGLAHYAAAPRAGVPPTEGGGPPPVTEGETTTVGETTTPVTPQGETTTPVTPTEEVPPVTPTEEVPPVKPTEEVPPVKSTEEVPPVKPTEEAPPIKPTEEKPPPKTSEGPYEFEGRDARQVRRDANSEPYPGESATEAQMRAKAAQQEIVNRLENLQPCFVAGTPVLTEDGLRAIEEIQVGSLVIAMDPTDPGSGRPRKVTELFRGESDSICRVTVAGQVVTCTQNHRFFVPGRSWVAARELAVGNPLLTPGGAAVKIEAVERLHLDRPWRTYNLHVAEVPTYFVGDTYSLLVHNANPNFNRPLWWLFGKKAAFRPSDVDGVSVWETRSEQDVIDMFKIRRGIEQRSSSDPHQAYTSEELASKGVTVEPTEGAGPMAGRLQHGSARPTGAAPGDLSDAQIKSAVEGINSSEPTEKATPKSMGCK
jgi:hypothetical protein